jgi:hypothetical protein
MALAMAAAGATVMTAIQDGVPRRNRQSGHTQVAQNCAQHPSDGGWGLRHNFAWLSPAQLRTIRANACAAAPSAPTVATVSSMLVMARACGDRH